MSVDGESRVKDVVEKAGKTFGVPVKLTGFVRYQLGEGIDRGPQGELRRGSWRRWRGLREGRPGALPLDPAGAVGPRPHFLDGWLMNAMPR